MQDYIVVRQPQPPFGGPGGGFFGIFPGGQFFPPGQGPGFFPPGQGPGFFPPGQGQAPPPFTPPSGGPGMGPPSGRPPAFTPSAPQAGVFAVDPGAIRPCRFRFVYIWLDNGQQFWAWLVFTGRDSVAGWRWTGFRWVYFGVDINRISSFVCY